jgi:hypothetical protein
LFRVTLRRRDLAAEIYHLRQARHLCRSDSARREAGRSPGAVSDEI